MSKPEYFNLHDLTQGIARELAPGLNTRVFPGEQAMLSVVTIAPHAQGSIHSHPEEQWGVLLEGSAVRIDEGVETSVVKGDFWRTPGNAVHGMRAGPDGCVVLDVFAPPREAYRMAGKGFGVA